MPPRWFHEGFDVVVFGRSYWRVHRFKDSPWEELGVHHRELRHDHYQMFRALEALAPIPESILFETRKIRETRGPEQAEEFQAHVQHDFLDRWWDELPPADRRDIAGAFMLVLLDPQLLLKIASIDVLRGLVKVRYGPEDGYPEVMERWEDEPSLPGDYARLRAYLESKTVNQLLYVTHE